MTALGKKIAGGLMLGALAAAVLVGGWYLFAWLLPLAWGFVGAACMAALSVVGVKTTPFAAFCFLFVGFAALGALSRVRQ